MSKTTIWIIVAIIAIFALFVWSSKLQNSDPNIVASKGMHWHPELHIFVDGEEQEIPANIGIGAVHNPIHTHDDSNKGLIHMEFSGRVSKDKVRLKEFFKVWGKDMMSDFGKFEKMTVNGKESTELGDYSMQHEDVINLYYTSGQNKTQ